MAKLVLGDITNITGNESSATATINANNQSTEDALENTLSRDGTSPNEMNADFDMNGYDIINAGTINAEACFIDGQDIASFVGAEGPPGPQGEPGSNGTNGEDGEDGAAATISVGTVTTGSAGSNVIVTNVGTTSAAVLDFTIPRGDTGAQGIQGIQGIQGPPGTNGTGTVTSIVAGTNIAVDDTDPANPIVSATGGAGLVDGDYGDITVSGTGTVMSIDAGVIVNADVNASAAIAVSKLAAVTASRALVSDGSGFVSPATTTSTEIGYVNGVTSSIQTQLNGKQTSDTTLTALAAYNTNGLLTQTAADTFTGRTLTGPAAGISVSNGNGVSGNPTLSLANDLSALEALASTGIAVRTTTDTWAQRSIAVTASTGLSVSNGDGVSGNPTLSGIDATTSAKGVSEFATAAEYRTGTDTARSLVVDQVWSSAGLTALTDGANIAVDFAAGFNFGGSSNAVLGLGGNRTLNAPSNLKSGQCGVLWFGAVTSTRTLTLNAAWLLLDGVETGPYSITTAQELGIAYTIRASRTYVTAIMRRAA